MKNILIRLSVIALMFSCGATENPIQNSKKTTKVSENGYWQQHVDYAMEIDMDVNSFQYKGKQKLVYTNNSPDVLNRVYYHLYFNAFQPGSEMDVRSRTIKDPDPRVGDRINKLQPNEIGYIKVNSLKQNGTTISHETVGTVLEVKLNQPIQPGESVTFDMVFDAQVPVQIRRSGRNNKEGVALSMTQWYPKLAEYDDEGWHADPYIGREFHGVWGDFDVKLTIDKNYVVGGTGYQQGEPKVKSGKKTIHFKAPKVHDFTWAADPDFIHDTMQVPNGPMLHFYYKKDLEQKYLDNWKNLQPETVKLMQFFSENVGKYPYEQYSVIQGGDGGMEYAMSTLITGQRSFGSLVGVTAHELAHTWFQFLLATNEAKHEWMDEGFTSYISALAMNSLREEPRDNPLIGSYRGYISLANSGIEQPLTTHADRYALNGAYGRAAYSKGAVFMAQLGYIIGEDNLKKTIKKYYNDFSFKHPKPMDIVRTAERITDLELDWYLIDFAQTTNTIDYGVKAVEGKSIILERIGLMPMPIDLTVTYTDGSTEEFYIPLQMMRGEKPTSATIINDWAWAMPTYTFEANKAVKSVEIDASQMLADVKRENNTFTKE
ncbi:M1 family metallopeptidase [Winogradskyella echinorum]|uniref:M1 family metallopeptidase n=1 Tax=Winogradskyella echinorum TaxID=538189 RepID=A0ABR6XZ60_9FLAO|nr:M1 family metallopeptidase [Winogradskyella echinorum]MBC3845785.1 M1 family metallopeptidase [Winogradskyella echinorum]MBC5750133.1 M1 family metallopeptidase [Winogradskyella echinorum]